MIIYQVVNQETGKSYIGKTIKTLDEVFDTASEAAQLYNLDLSTIIKCCRGKVKQHKGMKFRYAD